MQLRQLAEAATPGEWKAVRDTVKVGRFNLCPSVTSAGQGFNLRDQYDKASANAAYIAACSPDRILKLLDVVDAARGLLEAVPGDVIGKAALRTALSALSKESP